MRKSLYFLASLLISSSTFAQQPEDSLNNTFYIRLDPDLCDVNLKHEHVYEEEIDSIKGVRIIRTNSIPEHQIGTFPNQGNPNTVKPIEMEYTVNLSPQPAQSKISATGKSFGVLFSGVEVDPFTNEFFRGANGTNREWNITTLTTTHDLGLDCNNAHVQPNGKYHYHGTPSAFLDDLGVDGTKMIKVGYAADGYPIYYKYGYNDEGKIIELSSGYAIKGGDRPGDGKSAPDGPYDGTYFQDYEYKEALSLLDECNGRIGKTPESESEYYYVITDNFPSSPICFSAEPSKDFFIQSGGMANNAGPGRPNQQPARSKGGHPDPEEIMRDLDTNQDGKISKSEARGPMQQDFNRIDRNNDDFVSSEELRQMRPPQR